MKILFLTVNFAGARFNPSKRWIFAQFAEVCTGIGDASPTEAANGIASNVQAWKINKTDYWLTCHKHL